jgi:hypothetical protein
MSVFIGGTESRQSVRKSSNSLVSDEVAEEWVQKYVYGTGLFSDLTSKYDLADISTAVHDVYTALHKLKAENAQHVSCCAAYVLMYAKNSPEPLEESHPEIYNMYADDKLGASYLYEHIDWSTVVPTLESKKNQGVTTYAHCMSVLHETLVGTIVIPHLNALVSIEKQSSTALALVPSAPSEISVMGPPMNNEQLMAMAKLVGGILIFMIALEWWRPLVVLGSGYYAYRFYADSDPAPTGGLGLAWLFGQAQQAPRFFINEPGPASNDTHVTKNAWTEAFVIFHLRSRGYTVEPRVPNVWRDAKAMLYQKYAYLADQEQFIDLKGTKNGSNAVARIFVRKHRKTSGFGVGQPEPAKPVKKTELQAFVTQYGQEQFLGCKLIAYSQSSYAPIENHMTVACLQFRLTPVRSIMTAANVLGQQQM